MEDDISEYILKEIEAERDADNDTQKHIFFTTDEKELFKFKAEVLYASALDVQAV